MTTPNQNPTMNVSPPAQSDLEAGAAMISVAGPDGLQSNGFDVAWAIELLSRLRSAIVEAPDLQAQHKAAILSNSIRALVENVERGGALANTASALTLIAERRLGQTLSGLERTPGRGHERSKYQIAVDEIGVAPRTVHHWREVAAVPAPLFNAYIGPALDGTTTMHRPRSLVSRNGLLRIHRERGADTADISQLLASDVVLHDAAVRALGTVDMVPEPGSEVTTWRGRVLLAPADDDAGAWADACVEGWAEGRIEAALLHLPLRLEAGWWRLLAGHAVCLLRPAAIGRRTQNAGTVFGLGVPAAQLASAFADIGWTYGPIDRAGGDRLVDTP